MSKKGSIPLLISWIVIMVVCFAAHYYIVSVGAFCMMVYEMLQFFSMEDPDE